VCLCLSNHDAQALGSFLRERPLRPLAPIASRSDTRPFCLDEPRFIEKHRRASPIRVAWLCHFVDSDDALTLDATLADMPIDRREGHLNRLAVFARPVMLNAVDIRSRLGKAVRLYPILLPVTSRWMKHWIDTRQLVVPQALVQQGVDAARALGCDTVSLGQYTSIVTLNGRSIAAGGLGVTTGNSYTVALAIEALERAHRGRGTDSTDLVLGVAGALGNIGRTCAQMLAHEYRQVILVGSNRPGSKARLQALARRFPRAEAATDLSALADADAVIIATSAVDRPLRPNHFAPGAVVCDLAIPKGTRPDLEELRPDLCLIKGGKVRLPFEEDLEIPGFPLPSGQTFGCMAEGILLGLEGGAGASFIGPVRPSQVRKIAAFAHRHGFELSNDKRHSLAESQRAEILHDHVR
jgi:predicted amino acid dehydrogenase